jgi:hypothetical protein
LDKNIYQISLRSAKDFLKAEDSFFPSLGENKQGFDEYLRGILHQQSIGGKNEK